MRRFVTTRTLPRATPTASAPSSDTYSASGVYVPPSQFECLFPSTAHTDEHVDATVAAARAFFEHAT